MSSRSTNSNKSSSRSRSVSSRSDSIMSMYSADDSMQKKEFKQKHAELKQSEEKLQQLENLVKDSHIISYNAECVRKRSNWSKPDNVFKFDNDDFQPGIMKKSLEQYSPKLHTLLNKIRKLDEKDKKQHGKLFKHFIFSDLKYGNYGAKMLASALISQGYHIGYTADPKEKKSVNKSSKKMAKTAKNKSKKAYGAIRLHSNDVLAKTENNNFYMLSSSGVYDQNITVKMKKEMLLRFNQRPDNVHGELVRFIILDSGFKEGIDLFDVKYVHIFEPSTYLADQKQVIGRSTRTCGQKGLEFHPIYGWPLHVFIYDLYIPNKLTPSMLGAKTAMELYLKSMNLDIRLLNFTSDLEDKTILGSVDYDLNKNVHSFSIPNFTEEEEQESAVREIVHGGAGIDVQQIITLSDIMRSIVSDTSSQRLGHDKMREHIKKYYSEFAWDAVKMENLCAEKGGAKGGNNQVITYTPTQDFIRHYFTPTNPVKGMLIFHSVGTGKCHAKDTPILMHDGTVKMVQDIQVGEKLMGDDSTPRKVLSLAQGTDDMYDIIPVKGDKYRVNSEHILCLKYSGRGRIIYQPNTQPNMPYKTMMIDNLKYKIKTKSFKTREEARAYLDSFTEEDKILQIEVKDYLKLSESIKRDLKGYRKGVEFNDKPLAFDPYIIGLWLGDGCARGSVFSSQDAKILKYLRDNGRKYGLSLNYQSGYNYRLSKDGTTDTNILMDELHKYNLVHNKHIPHDYKCNSRDVRLKLLAGILDTDGYYCTKGKIFSISQKSDVLTNDILFLARSLGFAAYSTKSEKSCMYNGEKKTDVYNCITISGDGLDEIPTLLDRKRAEKRKQIKDVLLTGVKVEPAGKGEYYGFCIDGNHRYLMGDFTVTHNTCSAIATATANFERAGYTILWVTRTTLKNDIWKNMFDQVCNESIRNQIEYQDLEIPKDSQDRMKLLSKAWAIRPMSYKQFSNLILKRNAIYDKLKKLNGAEDPLRKCLLIIDEAHKLYGGDDLSSIEKPDMNALKKAIHYSYQYSGADSVRLLLMTATPITKDPMELIKLVNLCKPAIEQIPDDFDVFSSQYLDDEGNFSTSGKKQYLDDIAGYVSYLNREKDARQFSQPMIEYVETPIVRNIKEVENYDKKIMRDILESGMGGLKEQIKTEQKKLEGELSQINKAKFAFLKEECEELSGKDKSQCTKVVNQNITKMVNEAKDYIKNIKENIKDMNKLLKERKTIKNEALKKIKANILSNAQNFGSEYDMYKNTVAYQLKNKCSKRAKNETDLNTHIKDHPEIQKYNEQLEGYNKQIEHLGNNLKVLAENYRIRIKQLKDLLKTNLTDIERNVIRMVMRDEAKEYKKMQKFTDKNNKMTEKEIKEDIKDVTKLRNTKKKELVKDIKAAIKAEKKQTRAVKSDLKKIRKTMRSKGVKHEVLRDIVHKYKSKIEEDLVAVKEEAIEKERAKQAVKEAKKLEKEKVKAEKAAEREAAKLEKQKERMAARNTKMLEKAMMRNEIRATKKRMMEEKKAANKLAKEITKQEKAAVRKTKKNRSPTMKDLLK